MLQVFSATYLGGSLLILLGQAAIPVSMVISSALLSARYSVYQYVGAATVTVGLIVVLGPELGSSTGDSHGTALWSIVMILSCIPMCLSSVYKEKALGETELDAMYLNGWIAVFQFLIALPLTIPAAAIGDPPVAPADLLQNLVDGAKCYLGQNSIMDGPHKDSCEKATLYVTIYLLFNVTYNILMILILKYGSANILWLVCLNIFCRLLCEDNMMSRRTHAFLLLRAGDDDQGAAGHRRLHVFLHARAPAAAHE